MATAQLTRTRIAALLTAAAALTTGLTLTGATSGAASPAPTIHEVEAKIAAINVQAEKITEAYDAARGTLQSIKGKAAAAKSTLIKDQSVLSSMQGHIASMATAAYQSAGESGLASLLATGSPEVSVARAADLRQVARSRSAQLTQAVAADRALSAAESTYAGELKQESATIHTIENRNSQIQSLLAKEKQVLGTLRANQRAALARQQAARQRAEVAERAAYHAPAIVHHSSASYNGPATGDAAAAIRFAYAQLGKPYVYGAAGPDSYDCSGLTMRAWGAAGVYLPHNAAEQQASIPAVSLSDLEPGDLVFFGDPAYHVTMYVGGGNIIQAPETGEDVEITPLSYMPAPSGAGRP